MSTVSSNVPSLRLNVPPQQFLHTKYKKKTKQRSKSFNDENWEPYKNTINRYHSAPTRYLNKNDNYMVPYDVNNNENYKNSQYINSHTQSIQKPHKSPQLELKRQHDIRRGIFTMDELVDITHRDYPSVDAQCIIRFPAQIASILNSRLQNNQPLGLTITPTSLFDYRYFEIYIEGINDELVGVLVELPNIIESYKTLDGDLMFKSGDISQMLNVFSKNSPDALNIDVLKDIYNWEWKSGLTPATHDIRRRKFKNYNVFDRQLIKNAEYEVIELLSGLTRDSYEFLAHTEYDMIENFDKFQSGKSTERVITTNDDLQQFLESGFASDASDNLFGIPHTPYVAADNVRVGGTTRIGRPRRHPFFTKDIGMSSGGVNTLGNLPFSNNANKDVFDLEEEMKKRERKKLKKERKKLEKLRRSGFNNY